MPNLDNESIDASTKLIDNSKMYLISRKLLYFDLWNHIQKIRFNK